MGDRGQPSLPEELHRMAALALPINPARMPPPTIPTGPTPGDRVRILIEGEECQVRPAPNRKARRAAAVRARKARARG